MAELGFRDLFGRERRRRAEEAAALDRAAQTAAQLAVEQEVARRARRRDQGARREAELAAKREIQAQIAGQIRQDAKSAAELLTEHGVRTDFISMPLLSSLVIEPLDALLEKQPRPPRVLRGWKISSSTFDSERIITGIDTFGEQSTPTETVSSIQRSREAVILTRSGELIAWSHESRCTPGGIPIAPGLRQRRVLQDDDLVRLYQVDLDSRTAPEATEKWRNLLLDYTIDRIPTPASPR